MKRVDGVQYLVLYSVVWSYILK